MPADDASLQIADHAITRAIFLERWGDRIATRMAGVIDAVLADVLARLRQDDISAFTRARLESLLVELDGIIEGLDARLLTDLEPELREMVAAEIASNNEAMLAADIAAAVDSLTPEQVYAAALADPMRGRFLSEWFESLEDSLKQKVRDAIRIGYIEGETTEQIAVRVLELADARSKRDAQMIVRTAITHFQSRALIEAYKGSPDVTQQYRWLSVLDSRTTTICRARSNRVYKIDQGPLPPAHFGCRSTIAPLLKNLPNPEFTSYAEWLSRQPRALQDDILGPTRAKLFRDGGLPLDKFVNDRNGHVYTLEELARRERDAWRRAGLDEAA